MHKRVITQAVALLTVFVAAGIGYFVLRPDSCRGIPREFGGCDPDLAPYTATTCLGVAEEWGRFVNDAGLRVIGDNSPRLGKAARITSERWTITHLANYRLRDLGLITECDAESFYQRGSQEFSTEFMEQAPSYLYDVQPEGEDSVAYEEWEANVRKAVAMIDQAETEPAPEP